MLKLILLIVLLAVALGKQVEVGYLKKDHHPIYFRTEIEISTFFHDNSDFSVGIITCNNLQGFQQLVYSLAVYNTKRIKKIYIFQRCNKNIQRRQFIERLPKQIKGKQTNINNVELTQHIGIYINKRDKFSVINYILKQAKEKYILLLNDYQHVLGPYGFVEKAIHLLQHADQKRILGVSMDPEFPLLNPKIIKSIQYFASTSKDSILWRGGAILIKKDRGYNKILSKMLNQNKCEKLNQDQNERCLKTLINQELINNNITCLSLGGNRPRKVVKQDEIHIFNTMDYALIWLKKEYQILNSFNFFDWKNTIIICAIVLLEFIICFYKSKIKKLQKIQDIQKEKDQYEKINQVSQH